MRTPNVHAIAGVLIRAEAPHILAAWYAEVLQLDLEQEADQGFFGVLDTPAGPLQLAVVPRDPGPGGFAPARVALTFRVQSYERLLQHLDDLGLEPEAEFEHEGQGRFLYLRDLEGNSIAFFAPEAPAAPSPSPDESPPGCSSPHPS